MRESTPRLRDEGLQGFAIYHVTGSSGRVAVIDVFFDQVSFIEIEPGEQHNRGPKIDRQIYGGIAGGTWYARSQAWNRAGRIECAVWFLRQCVKDGGASLGGDSRIGRR